MSSMIEKIVSRAMSDYGSSGLFLSTAGLPERQSSVAVDLCRELLDQRDVEPIYVDLAGSKEDPEHVMSRAIQKHLLARVPALLVHARRYGSEVNEQDIIEQIAEVGVGRDKRRTYAGALGDLSDATAELIVMVINEVTLAETTSAGESTLYAMKAARDQLNGSAHHGFRLLATGSSRTKLSHLVYNSSQAFFCATLIDLAPMATNDTLD